MGKKLYVGNLPFSATDQILRTLLLNVERLNPQDHH